MQFLHAIAIAAAVIKTEHAHDSEWEEKRLALNTLNIAVAGSFSCRYRLLAVGSLPLRRGGGVEMQSGAARTRGLFPPSRPSPTPGGRGHTAQASQRKSEH